MTSPGRNIPESLEGIEQWIEKKERQKSSIRESCRARIEWAHPDHPVKTSFSIVYLHGFKASHGEGKPVHIKVARETGCNLFLSRLHGHGLKNGVAFDGLDFNDIVETAKEAYEIAEKLGERVIIMGTSTGASLALYLASLPEYRSSLASLVLYSPLIKFFGLNAFFLNTQTGRRLLSTIPGPDFTLTSKNYSREQGKVWYSAYKLHGVLELGRFIQNRMTTSTFEKITCPLFAGYYYKNLFRQDGVVSTAAIKKMAGQVGTPNNQIFLVNFPNAQTHIICNGMVSKSIKDVKKKSVHFLKKYSLSPV